MKLKSLDFREKRRASWNDFEKMLSRIDDQGLSALSPLEVLELSRLYRSACSSWYVAQNVSLDKNLHDYLENLVTRGYLSLYCSRLSQENWALQFLGRGFPQVVRKYKLYHLIAFLCLVIGAVVGYLGTGADPSYYFIFVERGEPRTPYADAQLLAEVLESGRDEKTTAKTYFASFLFTHNSQVGFLCFTLGIFAVPTVYLLFQNGGALGAMSHVYHERSLSFGWWAWILPHGITEFLAIIICGGCGLALAFSFIVPGPHGTIHRMKTVGRDAGLTMVGVLILFFIAGIIEGYLRQTQLDNISRYLTALLTFAFWAFYFGLCGKSSLPR